MRQLSGQSLGGPGRTCRKRMIPYVTLPRPQLSGEENRPSVECGKARVVRECWRGLDGPVVWIDRNEPSVEQRMQVASQKQPASRVVFRIFAVEVEVRGFERSGWLRAGEGAGFAVAGEHGFTESLLAKPGLGEPESVTAGDSVILSCVGSPPGVTGDQMCLQDRPQLRHVQAPDRMLLSSGEVGRIEVVLCERLVRRPPRAGVVGGEHLNAEFFLGWHVELGHAVGAPVDELLARPVLEVRARAVWAPVSDLTAG